MELEEFIHREGVQFYKKYFKEKKEIIFCESKIARNRVVFFFFIYGLVVMLLFFGLNIYVDTPRVRVYIE